jgi:hypothetical protein
MGPTKELSVTIGDFLITSLKTHLGLDETRWAGFLSDYLNANAGDIDDALLDPNDEEEYEETDDDESWPVCGDCGREIDLQEGPICIECRAAQPDDA